MKTVHKYQLSEITEISVPKESRVVLVSSQRGLPTIWIELDANALHLKKRTFRLFGTGHTVKGEHIGSFVCGVFVWHVYEQGDPA